MDHKVSKDMISSGMIPSGEKTQADLGRTQYGSAPSPSKLMDAYKSMYDKKDEVINEMKMGDVSGSADFASRNIKGAKGAAKPSTPKTETPKTDSRMDQVVKHGFAKSYRQIGPKSESEDMQDRLTDRKIERKVGKDMKRDRLKKIMADNESVDLLAAYRSIYEHHKKDADGNTIPHEDEELNEFVVTGTMAALKGLGAMATKLGAAAAKTGVKVGAKLGGKAGANMMKSVARNPMKAIDNINRVGYAAQTVGNLMPKPSVPAVTKKQNPQGGMISADADLFDIVKGQLLDEGYSEKEVNEIMVNLTEEQLEEFITAFTKKIATSAAKYGSSLGGKTPAAKMGPARPDAKPGQTGFKASSPSEVIADVNARKAAKANVLRDKMDSAVSQIRSGSLKFGSTSQQKPQKPQKPQTPKEIRKEITGKMKNNVTPIDPIRRRNRQVEQENADLFDIVKGQLLDEGMSEEEIKDIMLNLTPDEILNELSVGKMANYISAADKDVQKTADSMRKDSSVMGDDPRIKKMTNRAKGMAMAGEKIAKKMTPPPMN